MSEVKEVRVTMYTVYVQVQVLKMLIISDMMPHACEDGDEGDEHSTEGDGAARPAGIRSGRGLGDRKADRQNAKCTKKIEIFIGKSRDESPQREDQIAALLPRLTVVLCTPLPLSSHAPSLPLRTCRPQEMRTRKWTDRQMYQYRPAHAWKAGARTSTCADVDIERNKGKGKDENTFRCLREVASQGNKFISISEIPKDMTKVMYLARATSSEGDSARHVGIRLKTSQASRNLLRLETPCVPHILAQMACNQLKGVAERVETTYKPSQGLKRSQAVASNLGFFRHTFGHGEPKPKRGRRNTSGARVPAVGSAPQKKSHVLAFEVRDSKRRTKGQEKESHNKGTAVRQDSHPKHRIESNNQRLTSRMHHPGSSGNPSQSQHASTQIRRSGHKTRNMGMVFLYIVVGKTSVLSLLISPEIVLPLDVAPPLEPEADVELEEYPEVKAREVDADLQAEVLVDADGENPNTHSSNNTPRGSGSVASRWARTPARCRPDGVRARSKTKTCSASGGGPRVPVEDEGHEVEAEAEAEA
ncbi:hypothetical protein K438DRAFT_1773479 [Mycena galopus ATCC 62051]|nr:hypothetical protein K438DRAFT_1773479 [Mycena galopus ATCC 62051]